MSRRQKTKILAIDPGTREMGIAFLENDELIYHGVKAIKNRTSPHAILKEIRGTILRLIHDFAPSTLVVEKTFFANNRNAALLNVAVDEIRALGKRKRLTVVSFAPNTVKKKIAGNGRASKDEVARVVAAQYPELRIYLLQDKKWKLRYHENMFDAVALGLTARSMN
jgi:crossover junction endodeoxyribonuclease RuvC